MSWNRQPIVTVVAAAQHQAIDLTEAKTWLRVDHATEDDLIDTLITAAQVWVESYLRRSLTEQTCDFRYANFPQLGLPLFIPRAPITSLTSVSYLDENGASQTWASSNYVLRSVAGDRAGRAWVEVSTSTDYPALSSEAEYPVTVRAVCGYSHTATNVPAGIKAAILLLLGDMYSNRQETMIGISSSKVQTTVEKLLAPYRVPEVT